ncbi:MAG: succinate dehydrogenase/fumarate reductase iron-sulfur subunit [bacterium]
MALKSFKLQVWRQNGPNDAGGFEDFSEYAKDVSEHASFLEMLDLINDRLMRDGKRPIEFDSDCREGICGQCGCVINGQAHGPQRGTTACQLHMRVFQDGESLVVEPFRANAFPIIKDLVVDRSALDRIQQAGGYVTVNTGPKPDANSIKIGKEVSDRAFDAAACIGCGACVAACPNASASLFTGAKVTQFALLPQGHPERNTRVANMVRRMDEMGFGHCSNIGECEAACPKEISLENIAIMKREYLKSMLAGH